MQSDRSRTIYLIKRFTTKNGKKAMVVQNVWNREMLGGLSSLHDHYMGYVMIEKGEDYSYYHDTSIQVHGGVTFQGKLPKTNGEWVGFDMAHVGDENIPNPLEYAVEQCEYLSEQLIKNK